MTAPRSARAFTLALALTAPIAPEASSAGEQLERFRGVARGEDGAVRYLEEHEERWSDGRLLRVSTRYFDPEGAPIATLDSDFSADPFAPSYRFRDLRTGEEEEVSRAIGESAIELRSARGTRRLAAAGRGRPLVVGQGLHHLARAQLQELGRGGELTVDFGLPSRLDAFEFRLRGRAARPEDPRIRIRVEPASWFLRLLAPEIDVWYERDSRRLARYRGPSNLPGSGGETVLVDIRYAYPEAGDARAHR